MQYLPFVVGKYIVLVDQKHEMYFLVEGGSLFLQPLPYGRKDTFNEKIPSIPYIDKYNVFS